MFRPVDTRRAATLGVAILSTSASLFGQELRVPIDVASLIDPVRLAVVATDDRGGVVQDLRRGEFEIVEGNTPRPIEDVRFVAGPIPTSPGEVIEPILTSLDEQTEAARDGVRLFGIFLDEYHVTHGPAAVRARDALAAFVRDGIGPRDLVVVFKPLDSVLNIRLTRDHEEAARSIESFDPRRGSYEPRNTFEQNYIGRDASRIDVVRAQIATSAMHALTTHLGGLGAGRKALVVLSEGFASGARRRGDDLPTLDGVVRAANRNTVAIYTLDPRAWDAEATGAADTAGERRNALAAVAADTDGLSMLQPGDLATVWARLTVDASGYYVVTFRGAADAKFHPIEVRSTRRGVRIRARPGYWASSPQDAFRARLLAESAAPKAPPEPARRVSPLIRPWFGMTRGAEGQTRVRFVWEPASRVPGNRSRAQPPARVTLKAVQEDGTTVFEGVVASASPSSIGAPPGDPLQAVFDVAPGRMLVQMAIEDAVARVIDTDVRDVPIAALDAPIVLGTPQVWRARNAREFRAFVEHDAAPPVAAREFSRAEHLLVRVPVFSVGDAPEVSARLLSRTGSPLRGLVLSASADGLVHLVDLPLAGFAHGEYVVEFTARSRGREVKEALRFRVVP